MNAPRAYTLGLRAVGAEETRNAIVGATLTMLTQRPIADVTLESIAALAGCSVRTVLRRMGSRDRAIDVALAGVLSEAEGDSPATWSSVDHGLESMVDHYSRRGALVWSILSQEATEPRFARLAQLGRKMHHDEARRIVQLHNEQLTSDEQLIELVSVATDIATWHVLITTHSKTPRGAGEAMRRIVWALLTDEGNPP